jgi:signal transduction histidine kinase
VRRRIVSVAVLAAALATALFGVPLAVAVAVLFHSDERAELQRAAEVTAARIGPDLAAGRTPSRPEHDRDGILVGIYRLDGPRVTGSGPERADGPVRRAATGTIAYGGGTQQVVAVPVATGGRVIAVARAASPTSRLYLQTGLVWLGMAGLALAAVVAATLLARRQASRLARPLERLTADAQALGDGDFIVEAQPSGIAEIDAAGAALTRTAGRLGDVLARERAFSADASHQLRTPLTGLRLRLETALDDRAGLEPAVVAALESADQLERTIDELLALARDAPAARVPADLPSLLGALAEAWSEPDRPLLVTVAPDLPGTSASAAAVRQILGVLLDNAVRHGAGAVRLTLREAGTAVGLDVADEGPGVRVPPDQLFRRRTAAADRAADRAAAGHGIGLALARTLAEAEGGRLVLTRPGPGPVFTLLLPALTPSG